MGFRRPLFTQCHPSSLDLGHTRGLVFQFHLPERYVKPSQKYSRIIVLIPRHWSFFRKGSNNGFRPFILSTCYICSTVMTISYVKGVICYIARRRSRYVTQKIPVKYGTNKGAKKIPVRETLRRFLLPSRRKFRDSPPPFRYESFRLKLGQDGRLDTHPDRIFRVVEKDLNHHIILRGTG